MRQSRRRSSGYSSCLKLAPQSCRRIREASLKYLISILSLHKVRTHSNSSPLNLKGLYCEFGVGGGTTINFIASKAPHATIHGFDSFEGLPEDWRAGYEKGHFKMGALPKVLDNVRLHKGWFDKSLPVWAKEHAGPLAFAHLDADLYSSTKTVLDLLEDRIVKGTILHFDEYINYPGWREGEYKAFTEFVARRGIKFEYLGYTESFGNGDDQQVSIRILEVGK